MALKCNECIHSKSSVEKTSKDCIELDLIVNTHPDADHCGGINALLDGTYNFCCPIITTKDAKVQVSPKDQSIEKDCDTSAEGDCLRFWFQQPGKIYKDLEGSTVTISKKDKKKDCNEESILTTVKLPESKIYNYDVVLTGDSYAMTILETLGLTPKPAASPVFQSNPQETMLSSSTGQALKNPRVRIFQVPHHGSKSAYAKKKGQAAIDYKEFYMKFDADIYLISHGERYKHPHEEVITGILSAAVEKKKKCNIVVTATYFDKQLKIKDKNVSDNWSGYVTIYYFKKDISYVTLLGTEGLSSIEGLQLYTEKEVSLRIY